MPSSSSLSPTLHQRRHQVYKYIYHHGFYRQLVSLLLSRSVVAVDANNSALSSTHSTSTAGPGAPVQQPSPAIARWEPETDHLNNFLVTGESTLEQRSQDIKDVMEQASNVLNGAGTK